MLLLSAPMILVSKFNGVRKRKSADVVHHCGQSHRAMKVGRSISSLRVEQRVFGNSFANCFENAIHHVQHAQSMRMSSVRRPWKYVERKTELLDPSQSLIVMRF